MPRLLQLITVPLEWGHGMDDPSAAMPVELIALQALDVPVEGQALAAADATSARPGQERV